MTKFLWYCYFGVYIAMISFTRLKVAYLRKVDPKAADIYAHKQVQKLSRHVIKRSKTKINIFGDEHIPDESCVFVSNHQATFDIFAILAYVNNPTGFIAKKEIDKIPFVSGWGKEIHNVYIDRSNIKESIKVINDGVENIKKGYSMVIFPEGTRSLSSEMREFKKGSLKLALKANAPIIPITIDGTYRVLEVGNKVRGNEITIMFHEPIYPDRLSKEEQKNLTETVQNIIKCGLQKISSDL